MIMTTYQISLPEPFDFSKPENWPKWIRHFERFRQASNLSAQTDESQVNTMIYTMGNNADDILCSFHLTEEQKKNYDTVKEKFKSDFVKKWNTIFERACFNMRKQEGEPANSFITDLYCLAEHCGYGTLHDELIRDRLVVGLLNAPLSEKLQMDAELTLEKAITVVRQSEAVRKQQTVLRGQDSPEGTVHEIKRKFRPQPTCREF